MKIGTLVIGTFIKAWWYEKLVFDLPGSSQLTSYEARRVKHYYYGSSYLLGVFQSINPFPFFIKDRKRYAILAAMASFFDDQEKAGREQSIESFGKHIDQRKLLLGWLVFVRKELPGENSEQFEECLEAVFKLESRDNPAASLKKGGYSVLLFRYCLSGKLPEQERAALFAFGELIQLSDDIFDLWQDQHYGEKSFALHHFQKQGLEGLQFEWKRKVTEVRSLFSRLENPRKALGALHFLTALTRLCLDRYRFLQKKHGTLPLTDRGEMVTDMAKPINQFRFLKYLLFKVN